VSIPVIGQPMMEVATNEIFKVLCNCGNVQPRKHTQRFIRDNPANYRELTVEEKEQWQLTQQASQGAGHSPK
jgi:hypothetical protein